jgi:hypothetical protein
MAGRRGPRGRPVSRPQLRRPLPPRPRRRQLHRLPRPAHHGRGGRRLPDLPPGRRGPPRHPDAPRRLRRRRRERRRNPCRDRGPPRAPLRGDPGLCGRGRGHPIAYAPDAHPYFFADPDGDGEIAQAAALPRRATRAGRRASSRPPTTTRSWRRTRAATRTTRLSPPAPSRFPREPVRAGGDRHGRPHAPLTSARQPRRGLDLDPHRGLLQPGRDHRGGGPRPGEGLGRDRPAGGPVGRIGQDVADPHHVVERRARLRQRPRDGGERVAALVLDAARASSSWHSRSPWCRRRRPSRRRRRRGSSRWRPRRASRWRSGGAWAHPAARGARCHAVRSGAHRSESIRDLICMSDRPPQSAGHHGSRKRAKR